MNWKTHLEDIATYKNIYFSKLWGATDFFKEHCISLKQSFVT